MVDPTHFELPREQLEARLRWYEKKYGPCIRERGVHNWKNLFRKPNMYEWTILFMIIMALFIAWAYQHDIAICKEFINQQEQPVLVPRNPLQYNTSLYLNITIKEETGESGEPK